METSSEVELLLLASPVLALPAFVLPETVALPLLALWWLLLLTLTLLVLVILKLLLVVSVMRLLELGPVSLMLALPPPPELARLTLGVELLIAKLISVELLLYALPVLAFPPLVLLLTVALPVRANCELVLRAFIVLLFVNVSLLELLVFMELDECGPVSLMLALPPAPPPKPLKLLLLLTLTEAFVLFSLLALPVHAPPELVLPLTLALPDLAY